MICFSLGSHALSVSSSGKRFCSTPIAMNAAVDALATHLRAVLSCHQLRAELKHSRLFLVGLDDLNTLAGDCLLPVVALCHWEELLKHRELMRRGLQHLADQVFGQCDIIARHGQHRQDVAGLDRPKEVRERAVLQEACENPAYGPNSDLLPPMMRVSGCGTDIGGDPSAALP